MPDRTTTRRKCTDQTAGTVEQPDELIYIVRNESGEIMDVGIEEFVEFERMGTKYWKLRLTGKDEDNPIVLVVESESKIVVRPIGQKDQE